MSGVALHGDGDNGEDDSDAKVVGNAGEDDKDNQIGQDMESDDDDDDEGNDDGDDDEDKIVHEAAKVKKDNNSTVKESKAKEPIAEESPAATTATIDAEDGHVVYFYRRYDPNRKIYQLSLAKADTWMGLRRYLGPLVSQTGRFKIYGPDDRQISEVFWKPYPKDGKTFSFIFSELIFATIISTNSTAPEYSLFTMTITEKTLVHELRSLIHWEMRMQRWRAPEESADLELDVFLRVDDRPCVARMKPHHLISHYLQGKSEQLKIKVRNMEVERGGQIIWPVWNETMYWG